MRFVNKKGSAGKILVIVGILVIIAGIIFILKVRADNRTEARAAAIKEVEAYCAEKLPEQSTGTYDAVIEGYLSDAINGIKAADTADEIDKIVKDFKSKIDKLIAEDTTGAFKGGADSKSCVEGNDADSCVNGNDANSCIDGNDADTCIE